MDILEFEPGKERGRGLFAWGLDFESGKRFRTGVPDEIMLTSVPFRFQQPIAPVP